MTCTNNGYIFADYFIHDVVRSLYFFYLLIQMLFQKIIIVYSHARLHMSDHSV